LKIERITFWSIGFEYKGVYKTEKQDDRLAKVLKRIQAKKELKRRIQAEKEQCFSKQDCEI